MFYRHVLNNSRVPSKKGEEGEGSNKKPLELPATPKCPTGYTLTDKACKKITAASPAIQKEGDTSNHFQLLQPIRNKILCWCHYVFLLVLLHNLPLQLPNVLFELLALLLTLNLLIFRPLDTPALSFGLPTGLKVNLRWLHQHHLPLCLKSLLECRDVHFGHLIGLQCNQLHGNLLQESVNFMLSPLGETHKWICFASIEIRLTSSGDKE
uniref:Uncharacterized protein n=1 Tax=Lutzomyia longipalpis TaxID=7200 RepID=A0A1B0CCG1_LUTLO